MSTCCSRQSTRLHETGTPIVSLDSFLPESFSDLQLAVPQQLSEMSRDILGGISDDAAAALAKGIETASSALTGTGSSSSDLSVPVMAAAAAGVALVAFAAVAASSSSGTSSANSSGTAANTKASPPARKGRANFDVSIPYDAATRMAYYAWCLQNEGQVFNAAGYEHFVELYTARAVAEVTAKKRARDLAAFDNRGRQEIPPRQMRADEKAETPANGTPLFFAQMSQ
jgi:hypothetical protein